MFWKREKPRPWYNKLWERWSQTFISLSTVFGLAVSGYSYIAIDTKPFIDTTSVVAVADHENIYVQIDVISELPEQSYIVVNFDKQQVRSLVYPKGIPEGDIIMEIPIPFTSDEDHIEVNVEIVIVGARTLFMPQTLEVSIDVERISSNTAGVVYASYGS